MSLQVEVAEAICSALYKMPFAEFLGETDLPEEQGWGGRVMWFHVGEKPKDMRVTVFRPDEKEEVQVIIEWRNHWADARNPLKGRQIIHISTYAATQAMLQEPTTSAVLRVLEVYRDVLAEEGVAGRISDLVETSESEEQSEG